jgi:hypothetical protein
VLTCALSASALGATGAVRHKPNRSSGSYCAKQRAVFKDKHAFVGIGDGFVSVAASKFRGCSFGRMAADHIGYFRTGVEWQSIEWAPSRYDFAFVDQLVGQLAQHHLAILPVVFGTPAWLSTAPTGASNPNAYPPANPNQYAQFVALLVKRYGPQGAFWRENPKLPYDPIRAWEIWNEPNLIAYWRPKPNAGAYVTLLRDAYRAIKRVDKHATVVSGGMAALSATEEPSWLKALYRAGMHGYFNALAIHLYGPSTTWAMNRIKSARAIMDRFGDRKKSLWVTEFSWAGGPGNVYKPSQHGQGVQLSQFLKVVASDRKRLGIGELMWYGWQDKVYGPDPSWWGYHLGLYTAGLRPKPALKVLAAAAKRFDR